MNDNECCDDDNAFCPLCGECIYCGECFCDDEEDE